MITITSTGSFDKSEAFLRHLTNLQIRSSLESYGRMGVSALSAATPEDSGLAASSWGYEVVQTSTGWEINWKNSDVENGFHVAIMIQYGHGTGTGGYVVGRDYINPAIQPIFDQIANSIWEEVTRA